MIKNSLISLLLHLVLDVYTFMYSIILMIFTWGLGHGYLMHFVMQVTSILGLIGYFVSGYFAMVNQGSKIKNLLSVSLIAIVGFIIWIYCYSSHQNISNLECNFFYYYNFVLTMPHMSGLAPNLKGPFIFLIPLIPSVLQFLGLECKVFIKRIETKKRH